VADDSLISAIPDLVAFVRRDGVILNSLGCRALGVLGSTADIDGQHVEAVWPPQVASLLLQLTRRVLRSRSNTSTRFVEQGHEYEARVSAHGPDRVVCVLRNLSAEQPAAHGGTGEHAVGGLARRGFLSRFKQSVADAVLRDSPLAACVIHLDGLTDIARTIDFNISEQLATELLRRLPQPGTGSGPGKMHWYAGQLADGLIAAVVTGSTDRDDVSGVVQELCNSLRQPAAIGDAEFGLTPHAGVAILGADAISPKLLLDHARAAAMEARRTRESGVHFYSDTLRLRSLARLDVARELREAIDNHEVRLRYVGRHDLASGRLTSVVAYLTWLHPLRGPVRPAEFIPIAEHTGLAPALSRAVLSQLQHDWQLLRGRLGRGVRISFSALRHHIASDTFAQDIGALFQPGLLAAEELELRVSERTLARLTGHERTLGRLVAAGVRLAIDEVGAGVGSVASLARFPVHALQLDRNCVVAADEHPAALKVCRATIALARALEMTPISPGVDSEQRREQLLALGCEEGLGDLYRDDFGNTLAEANHAGQHAASGSGRAG
jgi:predicted signal transduction protein with EAL and GGDEF domain